MVLGLIVAVNCLKEFFGKEAGSMPDEEPEWSEMGKAEYGRTAAAEVPPTPRLPRPSQLDELTVPSI